MLSYWKNSQWAHPAGIVFESMAPWREISSGRLPAANGVPELARLANAQLDEYWARQK
ncbi:MAG: hypothetical protein ACOX4G_13625 [Limnochordia bacterium]